MPLVLVVDDDASMRMILTKWLTRAGLQVESCADAESLILKLPNCEPQAICLDLGLPGIDGLEALPLIRSYHSKVPVIVLTAEEGVQTVVEAMRKGAFDYLSKPPRQDSFLSSVQRALRWFSLVDQSSVSPSDPVHHDPVHMIGVCMAMQRVISKVNKIAPTNITVHIQGESGTGKELIARAIHARSERAKHPFVAVNCGAIPETLQDSEFFGHEKGAFTGAARSKSGRFEQAHGGTLFLDEVAELSASMQVRLLRVLQERRFERVGGSRLIESNFRLLTATHRDLQAMVARGEFRQDLYFRIAVMEVELPPLRAREGDIPVLIRGLLERIAHERGIEILTVEDEALAKLESYAWPGNIRELYNVLQRASVLAEDNCIRVWDLPPRVLGHTTLPEASPQPKKEQQSLQDPVSLSAVMSSSYPPMNLEELERWAIQMALKKTGGNLSAAVKRLGIGRTTLYRKIKQYNLKTMPQGDAT